MSVTLMKHVVILLSPKLEFSLQQESPFNLSSLACNSREIDRVAQGCSESWALLLQ